MKRGMCLLVTVGVIGASALATASAHSSKPRHVPTSITHDGAVRLSDGPSVMSGHVSSHPGICRTFRLVKVTAHYPSGKTRLLDVDVTSDGGAWAVKGDITGVDRLKAKVVKQTLARGPGIITISKRRGRHHDPPRHHRQSFACAADSVTWKPPDAGFVAASTASAAEAKPTRHFATTISHDGDIPLTGDRSLITGHVTSRGRPCSEFFFRFVKVTAHYPSGKTRLLDEDLTSFAGAWAVKADIRGADRLKAKSQAVRVSGGHGGRYPTRHTRVLCKAASVVWRVA